MKTLETERMTLRLGQEHRPTLEKTQKGHKAYMEEHEEPDFPFEKYEEEVLYSYLRAKRSPYGYWNFDLKSEKRSVGWCAFGPRLCDVGITKILYPNAEDFQAFELEIGWAVSKFHRNKGYATEGAHRLIAHAFEELKVRRLIALTKSDNERSLRVMEKLGMRIVENPKDTSVRIGVINRPT